MNFETVTSTFLVFLAFVTAAPLRPVVIEKRDVDARYLFEGYEFCIISTIKSDVLKTLTLTVDSLGALLRKLEFFLSSRSYRLLRG